MVGRSMVVGHILMVHTCSLMCTNHIDMTAHTPAFFPELGTAHIYVGLSTAGHSLISHLWSKPGRMVSHPCINQVHACLTSVIKHKTFTPCYVLPHIYTIYFKNCSEILLFEVMHYKNDCCVAISSDKHS